MGELSDIATIGTSCLLVSDIALSANRSYSKSAEVQVNRSALYFHRTAYSRESTKRVHMLHNMYMLASFGLMNA